MGLGVVEEGHASWWPLGNSIKVGETLSHFISENVYMDTHSETDPGCSLGETSSSNLERIELCAISHWWEPCSSEGPPTRSHSCAGKATLNPHPITKSAPPSTTKYSPDVGWSSKLYNLGTQQLSLKKVYQGKGIFGLICINIHQLYLTLNVAWNCFTKAKPSLGGYVR